VASVAESERRIRLVRNGGDRGAATALNVGLEHSRGEWVARIDADDRALPRRLERQLAFADANPDLVATSCLAFYINAAGERVARTHHDLVSREAYERYMAANQVIGLLHPGALIHRETLLAAGAYRPEYVPAEDIDMWNRMSERGLVMVQAELLMEYRVHNGAVSAQRFDLAHQRLLWVGASMRARRSGEPEPTWDEFIEACRQEPLPRRLGAWRELAGRRLYRQAANDKINGHAITAVMRFAGAMTLRPGYASNRLRSQLLRGAERQAEAVGA
jgi:hypothetical protein